MKTSNKSTVRTLAFLAVAAAYGGAHAQEIANTQQYFAPQNSVSVGIGHSSGSERDRARFGLFNGLRDRDNNLLLDFNYSNRSDAGRWLDFGGRNLGLDNREVGFSYRRLGDLRITGDYSEITRHDPRTINTGVQGAGTTTPTVILSPMITPGAGQDLNLELKRKGLGLGVQKWISPELSVEASFKNEEKDGARFWGRGFACSSQWSQVGACTGTTAAAVLMLPEPVNSVHRQAEAKLNYSTGKLNVSGAYYGSFYTNRNGSMTPSLVGTQFGNQNGGAALAADPLLNATLSTPMALWPDNQAHQLSLAGNYAFTPKTRVNFKYAYTRATQDESFSGMGLANAPAGRSDLGGRIDTTKAQVGFSSHPTHNLHIHGDLGYNEKKNKTPIDAYNAYTACVPPAVYNTATRACTGGTFSTRFYTNGNPSPKKYDAKIEAGYKLTPNYTLVGGLKYEREDFGTWTPTDVAGGVSGLKQKTAETGWRVELRRSMSETFNGRIAYEEDRRTGKSPWLLPAEFKANAATGVTEVSDAQIYSRTAIFPFIYMDRKREKIKLMGTWTPMQKLEVTFLMDEGKDTYSGPTEHGLRSFRMGNLSLDVGYALTDVWKLNAYASRGRQTVNSGHSTGYDAILKDTATAFGVGVKGALTGQIRVGGDLTWLDDRLRYEQTADTPGNAQDVLLGTTGGLPDVTYRVTRFNVYGEYDIQKNASVRLDFVHYRSFFNEWTYQLNGTPFLYSDNTTLNAQEKQTVTFLGGRFIYKFQ